MARILSESENLESTRNRTFLFLGLFLIYLLVRWLAWMQNAGVEHNDSIGYLNDMKVFLSFDLQNIIDMNPDSTPFYPFFGALCSLPGWSVETGARLCSLLFSLLLFVALIGIGKQIATPMETVFGLLIVTFCPVLIFLSVEVLSEPSYIATSYLGLWFFWRQYKHPQLWTGMVLGIVYGLCFLSRNEGILYLVTIPLLQIAHFLFVKGKEYGVRRLVGWACLFLFGFSLVSAPQIWRVSQKMGVLGTNGRDVWTLLLKTEDGKSFAEKIYGLEFSPGQTNLHYVQSHPEARSLRALDFGFFVEEVAKNFDDLYRKNLGRLIGPLGLVFFVFGLISLYQSHRTFDVLLIMAFIGLTLVGPLLADVVIRHIAIVAPLVLFVAGIGVAYVAQPLSAMFQKTWLRPRTCAFILLSVLISMWAPILAHDYLRPTRSTRVDVLTEELMEIVRGVSVKGYSEDIRIVGRTGFLAYFTDGTSIPLPYTDYSGLVKYCELNKADFLFLQHSLLDHHPFLEKFTKGKPPPDFAPLYSHVDNVGGLVELFRFKKLASPTAVLITP